MMNQKTLNEEIESLSTETRLLVMIEIEPLSDKYSQILLNPEDFKEVSRVVFEMQPDSVTFLGTKKIIVSDDFVVIKDKSSCYSDDFINDVKK